jgi:hypothetical protein
MWIYWLLGALFGSALFVIAYLNLLQEGGNMPNRVITMIGVILAVLAAVFSIANIITGSVIVILAAAVVLIGIGVITGM